MADVGIYIVFRIDSELTLSKSGKENGRNGVKVWLSVELKTTHY